MSLGVSPLGTIPLGASAAEEAEAFQIAWVGNNYINGLYEMFKKNTAVTGFTVGLVSVTDGSDITTGTPAGYYTLDGGTQTAIGDISPVHEGNGQWSFDLTAGEMNGDIVGLTFTHASAITAHFIIKTSVLTTDDTLNVDIIAISGDSAAADNLELQYDGTGITDDTFPATQAQVSSIVNTGSAVNVLPILAPNGFTLTTGSEVGDEDRVHALDGIKHELSDDAGTLDAVYKFDLGGDAAPVGITFTGLFNSANDSWAISANIGTNASPVWQQIGTLSGSGGGGNTVHPFDMFSNQLVTDMAGIVQIRVNGTGLTSSSFDSDQVFVSKSDTSRSVGYALGRVWLDTVNGVSGTESFVNGTGDNPCSTITEATTIAGNVGLSQFNVAPGSSVTLTQTYSNAIAYIYGSTLALGGQDISNTLTYGGEISGISSGTGPVHFTDAEIQTVTFPPVHFDNCSLTSTFTMGSAGEFVFSKCYSEVTSGQPVIDFAAVGASQLNMRDYSGGIEIQNMASGDTMSLEGDGALIVNANCSGGTINYRGNFELIDNSGGSITIVADDNTTNTAAILAGTNELQTNQGNWLTATGFATETKQDAQDAIITEARLAELDAANIPSDLDDVLLDTGTTLPALIDDLAINKNTSGLIHIEMVLTSDHVTPATGLTVTAQRLIDSGTYANVTGSMTEISNGTYRFDYSAADANGDLITWKFSSGTADDTKLTFKTVA